MLKTAGSAAAISVLGGIPLSVSAKDKQSKVPGRDRKKILVIGAHPDDPETAAGGTMCLLSDAGHERKHQACYCHASQKLQSVMADWHIPMEQFRGIECRCKAAEAFARHIEPASLV